MSIFFVLVWLFPADRWMGYTMMKTDSPMVRIRVTILLRREDGRVCFARHMKNNKRYWLLPGGGQSAFEPLEETARRELEEELRISVSGFRFLALRESFSEPEKRHIQFPILEGLDPDFSRLARGDDDRVEGADFFNASEAASKIIYPGLGEDLPALIRGDSIALFRTLSWIS